MNSNQAYMYNYYSFAKQFYIYLHIFTNTNVSVFFFKCTKLSTFYILQIFATIDVVALKYKNQIIKSCSF